MNVNEMTPHQMTINERLQPKIQRSVFDALKNGLKCQCPNCSRGSLYDGFVSVKPSCNHCGEELHHHRADDLPPYINIFIVGHIIVGLLMVCMKFELFGMWTTAIGGSLLAIVISIALMRPIKGMVIGLQWALGMHGFDSK